MSKSVGSTPERSPPGRRRLPTIKGAAYEKERRKVRVKEKWRHVKKVSDTLLSSLNTLTEPRDVIPVHQDWLIAYEEYSATRDMLMSTLTEEEHDEYVNLYEDKEIWLANVKMEAEKWFTRTSARSVSGTSRASSRSAASSRSRSSRASMAKSLELQMQRAEIQAIQEGLQKRQELEQEELRLRQLKEENALVEKLKITEARQRVLDDLEEKDSLTSMEEYVDTAYIRHVRLPEDVAVPVPSLLSVEDGTVPTPSALSTQNVAVPVPSLLSVEDGTVPTPSALSTQNVAVPVPSLLSVEDGTVPATSAMPAQNVTVPVANLLPVEDSTVPVPIMFPVPSGVGSAVSVFNYQPVPVTTPLKPPGDGTVRYGFPAAAVPRIIPMSLQDNSNIVPNMPIAALPIPTISHQSTAMPVFHNIPVPTVRLAAPVPYLMRSENQNISVPRLTTTVCTCQAVLSQVPNVLYAANHGSVLVPNQTHVTYQYCNVPVPNLTRVSSPITVPTQTHVTQQYCNVPVPNLTRVSSPITVPTQTHVAQQYCNLPVPNFTPVSNQSLPEYGIGSVPVCSAPVPVPYFYPVQPKIEGGKEIRDVVNSLQKPKLEIKSFSGDPTTFNQFLRQFKSRVERICDQEECMYYLEQFTQGKAHKIVTGLAHLSADIGYPAAMKELAERFGDPEVVANAYVKRVLSWPTIRGDDAKALDDFAIFLKEVETATHSIGSLGVLDFSENLKVIVSKLPFMMHKSWRNLVYKLKGGKQRPGFKQLVEFIQIEAKKSNDPVYGKPQLAITQAASKNKPVHSKVSAANVEVATIPKCLCCGKDHELVTCPKLKDMTVSGRLEILKKNGICFLCFRKGHPKNKCFSKIKCSTCKLRHNTLLHRDNTTNVSGGAPRAVVPVTPAHVNGSSSCMTPETKEDCTLAVIAVKVSAKWKSETCYAFFDPGSNVSFCSKRLMTRLGLRGKRMPMNLDTMLDSQTVDTYLVNGLVVSDKEGVNRISMPTVYCKDTLPVKVDHIPTNEDIHKWNHLKDINLPELNYKSIDLLIGNNVPSANAPLDVRTGPEGSPFATRTLLGWIPWGVIKNGHVHATSNFVTVEKYEHFNALEKFYRESLQLDFPERTIDDKREWSQEDHQFVSLVRKEMKVIDGHYELPLPLKKEVKLPSNEVYVRHRLNSLQRKLENNPEFKGAYDAFMENILTHGYAELVPQQDKPQDGDVWYIPHHGVYHPKKRKLRVVFDCAARYHGIALNDVLLTGPNLLNSLHGVLMRFRQHTVAFISDIETMFYKVRVPEKQRNLLRFLWWTDGDLKAEPQHYRMTVHLFGASSSPSCANFALQQTARDNANRHNEEAVSTILNDFYMDDCLKSTESGEDALSLIRELKELCSKGGFNLTKWICNEKDVLLQIPTSDRSKSVKDLDLDKDRLPAERALGVQWNISEDSFNFKSGTFKKEPTRRNILSAVSSVYDPLGFIAPVIMPAKCILQEMCRLKTAWDDEATGKCLELWERWCTDVEHLEKVKIPRCYTPKHFGKVVCRELHSFSDASNIGYGCAIYLRQVNEDGNIHCVFVMGKARVAPLKKVTIPRMELTAATIAAKLSKVVGEQLELRLDQRYYWTDSTAVLRYINNTSARFHTFVANRVQLIREATLPCQWKFVDSKQNPADVASRGEIPSRLIESSWLNSPNFLWNTEDDWPEQLIQMRIDESDKEVKAVYSTHLHPVEVKDHPIDTLTQYYSSWHKLKMAVAYIIKFKKLLLAKVRKMSAERCTSLTVTDLREAETLVVKHVQGVDFPDEIKALRNGEVISRSSPVRKLDLLLEDDVVKVGGRLSHADISKDARHPTLISKNSTISNLILREIHENCGHGGRNFMLTRLREKFWITAANSAARKVINRCVKCRKRQGRPFEQKMADLPADRVRAGDPPFTNVGMDFFGPLFVKQGRATVKRYGVVFVCLASKAIHIEVACSLDTDACINSIRRCIARRGSINTIRCDNGTNLVGAQRELKKELAAWNLQKIEKSMLQKGITWMFNPPGGSHHGGIWERQIRSIRKILWSLANQQTLSDDTLHTFICEVEAILNSRPITALQEDATDLGVLTPNNILLLKGDTSFPPCATNEGSYYRKRWKQAQYLADIFWIRWTKEYLPSLQSRQKWLRPRRNAKVGDIVLILNESTPRNMWPLGRIIEVFMNQDGLVRRVKVKTEASFLIRPVDKLCLLLEGDD